MKPTQEMYTTLFNGITDVIKELKAIIDKLDKLQQKTEQIYIEQDEDEQE